MCFQHTQKGVLGNCTCNLISEACMSDNCAECAEGALFVTNFVNHMSDEQMNSELKWQQWQHQGDGNKYIQRVTITGTVEEAVECLANQLTKFKWYVFIRNKQAEKYKHDNQEVSKDDSDIATIQMDFAENVSTLYQDEIQAAHWHKRQITVFTIRIKHRKTPLSWIIVTDLNTHDKHTVAAFLFAVITTILSSMPTAKTIRIWTDGPSSQFRNKYVFALAAKLQ